ncbi:extracellular solute-binding protein [Micromonospora sp. CPCC 206061]|uniref:extracellular solute-binding protein n=1 Tax=Micromonospora sp. CPCC 206061 TaxID=3122410 RepID=UPI002FF42F92
MTTSFSGRSTDRRTFLSLLGTGAAATVGGGLLGGCSNATKTSQGSAGQKSGLSAVVPQYKPYAGLTPDIPAAAPGALPGYLRYPRDLIKAVPTVRGKGSELTVMSPLWGSPPASTNAYYAAIAARTGTPLKWNVQDGNTYRDKLTALLGAADVPDVLVIASWHLGIPRISEAIANLFADLTPMLKGDISGHWPLLANIPTDAWQSCVWGGQLKAIPWVRQAFTGYFMYRKDLFQELGVTPPKNADELLALAKAVTDPAKGRWAFNDLWQKGGGPIPQIFRVPIRNRGWVKDPSGKMVSGLETDEFEAGVAFARKLFDAKVVHPAAAGGTSGSVDFRQAFQSGKIVITSDGFGGIREAYAVQSLSNPAFRMEPFPPFAHDGKTPVVNGGDTAGLLTFVNKKLPKDKIEEYLTLADWCSAPFGTEENLLLTYGVEGTHFTRDANGAPSYTAQGQKDAGVPTYDFLGGRPPVVSESQYPDYVQMLTSWYNNAVKYLDKDMFAGIRIEEPAALQKAGQPVVDKVNDIIFGRRPVSDLEQIRKEWRSAGGDEGRAFYEKVVKDNNL